MKNRTLICAASTITLVGTAQAMDTVKRLFLTPPIVEIEKLTQEQQDAIKPVYKDFCIKRRHETNQAALWRGVPALLGAGCCALRANTLLNQAGTSAWHAANNAPNWASSGIASILNFATSGKTYKSIGLLGMSLPLAAYGWVHAARVVNSGYKLHRADKLAYLNDDLYKQLGKPHVLSNDEIAWRVTSPSGRRSHLIYLTKQNDLQQVLDGNLKSTEIEVPVEHYGNW
jgi:hypothetical protein